MSSEVTVTFTHNIEGDIEEHLEAIERMVQAKLAELLALNPTLIIVKETSGNGQTVQVIVLIKTDGRINLPLVLLRVGIMMTQQQRGNIQYGDYMLRPQGFETNHNSLAQRDGGSSSEESAEWERRDGSGSDSDSDEGCSRIWRAHPGMVIAAGVAGAFIITVIGVVVTVTCCRKRGQAQFSHQRLATYKENLTYGNDLTSHPDVIIKDKSSRSDSYAVTVPETQNKY